MAKQIETNTWNIFKNTSVKKKGLEKEKKCTLQKKSTESLQKNSFGDTFNNNNKHHHQQIWNQSLQQPRKKYVNMRYTSQKRKYEMQQRA